MWFFDCFPINQIINWRNPLTRTFGIILYCITRYPINTLKVCSCWRRFFFIEFRLSLEYIKNSWIGWFTKYRKPNIWTQLYMIEQLLKWEKSKFINLISFSMQGPRRCWEIYELLLFRWRRGWRRWLHRLLLKSNSQKQLHYEFL